MFPQDHAHSKGVILNALGSELVQLACVMVVHSVSFRGLDEERKTNPKFKGLPLQKPF